MLFWGNFGVICFNRHEKVVFGDFGVKIKNNET